MGIKHYVLGALAVVAIAACAQLSQAQTSNAIVVSSCGTPPNTYTAGTSRPITQDTNGNGCSAASVSASISGFAPATTGTPISVTTGGVTGTLPAGAVVVASNVGTTNTAYCKLGASATTSDQPIAPNGGWFAFTVGANTQLTCITSTSTTTVNMVGGAGLPTGTGGGGGGSGGGGAVTIADGADVTLGAKADAKSTATDTTPVTAMQVLKEISAMEQAPASRAVTNAGTFATQLTGSTNNINNISGTVSLPTGAATSALQPSNAAQGSTTSGQTGHLVMGAVTTSSPSYTTAQTSPLSLDTSGNLRVNIVTGSSSGAVAQGSTTSGQSVVPMGCRTLTSAPTDTTAQTNMPSCDTAGALRVNVTSATGVSQGSTTSGQTISPIGCRTLTSAPTDTTAQTNMPWCRTNGTLAQDLVSINGTTVSTGTGAQGSGTPRVTVATDTATIAGSAPGTAGTASSNVVTVQGIASMTPVQTSLVPTTTNGATAYGLQSAASTNSTNVKNAAGTLLGLNLINTTTTIYYLRMYDSSSAPTCSSATNFSRTWPVPPAAASGGAGGIAASLPVNGVAFANGISFCLTGGPSSTDNTNAATGVFVNIDYK